MESLFVGYNEAKQLSELGFSEQCFAGYLKKEKTLWIGYVSSQGGEQFNREYHILAPTFSQAFKFFRENHNLLGNVYSNASGWLWEIHDNIGGTHRFGSEYSGDCEESGMFTSFDNAELECLIKLIEIVKQQK